MSAHTVRARSYNPLPSLPRDNTTTMKTCHAHNLNRNLETDRPHGIRISLPAGDSFQALIGKDWERFHWYATEQERDDALEDKASEHLYSRRGDRPRLVFEKVERTED